MDLTSLPPVWLYSLAGITGLILGSFFNVVIVRLPRMISRQWRQECAAVNGQTIAQEAPYNLAVPASHCPQCKAPVRAWDNIPVLSYLLLRGRCRHCKTSISARYPLLEIISALVPVLCLWYFGPTATALAYTLMLWLILILSMIDIDHMLLPDSLNYLLLWTGLIASIAILPITPADAVIGAVSGYLFLWSIYWLFKLLTGKEGLGYGDFKLLAALGAWLGWQSLPLIILLASLSGALIGGLWMLIDRNRRGKPMPFGPYLALGGVITVFFGDALWQAYLQWAGL